ncbi:polysaccharide biosynthesis protein [Calditrichota bacterium]
MSIEKFTGLKYRIITKIGLDSSAFLIAFAGSFLLRFPNSSSLEILEKILYFLPFVLLIRLATFGLFRLYSTMWRYAGTHDLMRIVQATTLGSILIIALAYFSGMLSLPRSVVVMDWFLVVFITGANRLGIRHLFSLDSKGSGDRKSYRRVLIYGAGRAGEMLLRNIENTGKLEIFVVGFLDDDPVKIGQYIHNKRVLGDRSMIGSLVKKHNVSEIYFTVPRLPGSEARAILRVITEQAGNNIAIKTTPGLTDLIEGRVSLNQLRNFEIKDLLRREQVRLDFTPVKELIRDKTVMIVGGGGSIGSELCVQTATYNPKQLIVLENSEFNLYRVEGMLKEKFPSLNLLPVIADAANQSVLSKVFLENTPNIIFHAAAYKHVPLMELNPKAAVHNNINSTLNLCELSLKHNVERFILISTDKAVQPTSVMGATKRVCELITQAQRFEGKTSFMSVRFGNVLGSSGSVIPKFKEQIAEGGPITVTHKDITRYFMLVSEAVELVLQAGAIGENGNTYVLDMGNPIKIVDLAKLMIELSGLRLNEDIKIVYTGLRPGEKLHESLYFEGEESATRVPNIFVLKPKLIQDNSFPEQTKALVDNLHKLTSDQVIDQLCQLAPEYAPNRPRQPLMSAINADDMVSTRSSGTAAI